MPAKETISLKKENDTLRKELSASKRELKIEASLDKVRSIAMRMKKRDDMVEVCRVISDLLIVLGVKEIRNVQTAVFYESKGVYMNYEFYAKHHKTIITETSYTSHKIHKAFAAKMLKGRGEFYATHIKGQKVKDWIKYQKTTNVFIDKYLNTASSLNYYWHSLGTVALGISTYVPLSKDELDLFRRFLKVFELAFRRFLDIKKAEAQAWEAQIELSLERVRARAMAMQHSNELAELVATLFRELNQLDFSLASCIIWIHSPDDKSNALWIASDRLNKPARPLQIVPFYPPFFASIIAAWKAKDPKWIFSLTGTEKKKFEKLFFKEYPELPEALKKPVKENKQIVFSASFSHFGALEIVASEPLNDEKFEILHRFGKVFDSSYTRFNDLKKAEAQARESQIQLALERVRARTMAMQKSDELPETSHILFQQMKELGEPVEQLTIGIVHEEDNVIEISATLHGGMLKKIYRHSINEPFMMSKVYKAWKTQQKTLVVELKGDELNAYNKYRNELTKSEMFPTNLDDEQRRIVYAAFFSRGMLALAANETCPPQSLELLERFASVFDLTYTRFLDLQKAEAQAREAQIEAALERVRSRTMAMQKSDELAETAAVMFNQLIHLGIAPNRLYIGIIKDESGDIEAWATDEDGSRVSKQFTLNVKNPSVRKIYDGWRKNKKSVFIDMQGKELEDYLHYLHDDLNVPFRQGLTQKRRVQNIAYFSKGFIGIASPEEQPEETAHLLERFAAVFNLTYTRFNDLQIAEAHALQAEQDLIAIREAKQKAEEALTELQATQKQLIQSEKMASLGELTAGIAHEIQNPLNFVNNFSEVSNELIDEMNSEIEKGDFDEAKLIANDIKQNLEKINHHGKRADAIVKGMLQHSRSSTSTKEPTDINKLADEYLRLAYHGLRAKDKSFNATMKTDFDETIGKINIIPQDIGRVILNLITNAFYVVNEKALSAVTTPTAAKYEPTVSISTKKINNKVEINVADNGNGIPQKILDKIFQPFFTTKPTGQGTGLGLSLSYDIVKAHAGELKVETKEGEGSIFRVILPVTYQN